MIGGPGRPDKLQIGLYARPTIFSNVSRDMRIAQEEIFGPVLSIIAYDTVEEAIEIANDTVYGLGAHIQGTNMATATLDGICEVVLLEPGTTANVGSAVDEQTVPSWRPALALRPRPSKLAADDAGGTCTTIDVRRWLRELVREPILISRSEYNAPPFWTLGRCAPSNTCARARRSIRSLNRNELLR